MGQVVASPGLHILPLRAAFAPTGASTAWHFLFYPPLDHPGRLASMNCVRKKASGQAKPMRLCNGMPPALACIRKTHFFGFAVQVSRHTESHCANTYHSSRYDVLRSVR